MALQDHDTGHLLPGAPEAVTVTAHHVAGVGWSCSISVRRQFQLWGHAAAGHYEFLTTEELLQVITDELDAELLS